MHQELFDTVAMLCQAGNHAPQTALELLRPLAPDAHIDALGSVVGSVGSGRKTILLDAHIDQIGLTVTASADDPTVCLVEFSFAVAHGLNQIHLAVHLTV